MTRAVRGRSARRGGRTPWPPADWELRFRAAQVDLPDWAEDAPDRACVVASAHGVLQVHSWDVATGRLVQATDRPAGTTLATIDPAGQWLWWFDDTDGDEYGVWRRQPFASPPSRRPETPIALPASYPSGLLLARDGTGVIGRSDEGYGTTIHQVVIGPLAAGTDAPVLLYTSEHDAEAAALSHDGNLVAVEHSERGDARHPALRVLLADTGAVLADLDDGPGSGLWALDFAPIDGDPRLLVLHERGGHPALAVWDLRARVRQDIDLGLPGEVADAAWYPDARGILVAVDHDARTRLVRYDVTSGQTTPIGPTDGTVAQACPRPDGDAWVRWSSAAVPRSVRSARTGLELLPPMGARPAPSVPVEDVWVDGPGGRVHALLRLPPPAARRGQEGPYPVVVDVHGGPEDHRTDSFSPSLAAWVDHGFAVLSVNYRGSTGYGSAWRDAIERRVGFTELEDIAAVHEHLVRAGVLDPARSVLAGASWGGYLTLLGLGTQPERWTVGVADVPVADYVAAYEVEMSGLQAFDRALFGGSPSEVPDAYRAASPVTYVDAVRAPVLVLAGTQDPRCPIRQVERYVGALRRMGGTVELRTFGAGHGSYADDERVGQMRAQIEFVLSHL
ncbi:prolyl oligopeptidase family serine peptidase [Georgenia sp. MJ206]|uniref:prolyl oligopeptidase family serine peptidase n=1 Tax=Georgenia wangjunii TaxID=3117730 RepID=UPI002F2600D8